VIGSVLPLAWDPIGIGDTLTGVVLGVLGVVGLISFFLSDLPDRLFAAVGSDSDYYLADRKRRITRGVLICDWVDGEVLATVAKQKEVEPDPDRLERGDVTTTGGGVAGGHGLFRGRFNRERKRDQRSFYDLTKDPNALLGKVLRRLHDDEAIDDNLDVVWGSSLLGEEMLDDVVRVARDKPEVEAARNAVRALQSMAIQGRVAEGWKQRSGHPRFVLVESQWKVARVLDTTRDAGHREYVELALLKLRQHTDHATPYGGPDYRMQQIEMPEDLKLVVNLPLDRLTDPGKSRVRDGATIAAGVLGTAASFNPETDELTVTPIAVFARIET
jgi:hypothetical protein